MKLARKLLAVLLAMALCPLLCAGAEEALPESGEPTPVVAQATDIPDVPQADAPVTEAPATDIPQTEATPSGTPETEAPATDIPAAAVPTAAPPDADIAPAAAPSADPFADAQVRVERVGDGELHIGDELSLEAKVTGVGVKYELIWLACPRDAVPANGKLPWKELQADVRGGRCSFVLTRENARLRYAAQIVGTEIMGIYELPAVAEESQEPEAVHPLLEPGEPLLDVTEGGTVSAPDDDGDAAPDEPDDAPLAPEEEAEAVHPLLEPGEPLLDVTEDGTVSAPDDDGDAATAGPEDAPAEQAVAPGENEDSPRYEYERDADGELVLDEDGNPIPARFMSGASLEDLLDPGRSIEISADWGGGTLRYGAELALTAVLHGYDNAVYSLQWQRSADGVNWEDIPGQTGLTYVFTVTRANASDSWRVSVTITDATPVEGEI